MLYQDAKTQEILKVLDLCPDDFVYDDVFSRSNFLDLAEILKLTVMIPQYLFHLMVHNFTKARNQTLGLVSGLSTTTALTLITRRFTYSLHSLS